MTKQRQRDHKFSVLAYIIDVDVGDAVPLGLGLVVVFEAIEAKTSSIVGTIGCENVLNQEELNRRKRYSRTREDREIVTVAPSR